MLWLDSDLGIVLLIDKDLQGWKLITIRVNKIVIKQEIRYFSGSPKSKDVFLCCNKKIKKFS